MYGHTKLFKGSDFCWTYVFVVPSASQRAKTEPLLSSRNDRETATMERGKKTSGDEEAEYDCEEEEKKYQLCLLTLSANDAHEPHRDPVGNISLFFLRHDADRAQPFTIGESTTCVSNCFY